MQLVILLIMGASSCGAFSNYYEESNHTFNIDESCISSELPKGFLNNNVMKTTKLKIQENNKGLPKRVKPKEIFIK